MTHRHLIAGLGSLLGVTGGLLVLRGGAQEVMQAFGSAPLPQAAVGDPAWVGVAFMRVFGAAMLALGLTTIGASKLSGEAARAVGAPLAVGLGVLGLVTCFQAQAIWSTPGAWVLGSLIGASCVAVAVWRPVESPAVAR